MRVIIPNLLVKLTYVLLAVLTLSSCYVSKTSTSKTTDIYGSGVIHLPVVAELDVSNVKVTGTAAAAKGTSIEVVKQDAVADALKKANADVLVEPKFETETTASQTTATVTGFPATYKNFRPITAADVPLLEVGVLQVAKLEEPSAFERKKGGAAGKTLGVLLGIGLGLGLLVALI